jgi:hypothetical protein
MEDYEILQQNALNFWPVELSEKEKKVSIIPQLITSQDKFISLLNIADATPFSWKNTIEQSKSLPANLFLKHLMVLSDMSSRHYTQEMPGITKICLWMENIFTFLKRLRLS